MVFTIAASLAQLVSHRVGRILYLWTQAYVLSLVVVISLRILWSILVMRQSVYVNLSYVVIPKIGVPGSTEDC
jgi:hypothetical protein